MSVLERATRHALYVAAVVVPSLLVTARAEAQDASPRWQFYFTPYLWVSGISVPQQAA